MKILVVPRIFHLYSHEENFYVNNYFITIGEREGYEGVPNQFNGDNILRLVFDDVNEILYKIIQIFLVFSSKR